jgi:hypothetical protein
VLPVSDPLRGQNARGSIDEVIDLDEVTPQQNPLLTDVIERKLHPFAGQHSQSFRTPFGTLLITQVGPIGKNSESHLRMCFSDELLQPGRHKSIDLTNFRKNSE